MAKTLAQIEQQIQKLRRTADEIKARETRDVVARIREAIEHYGLTANDLFGSGSGAGTARGGSRSSGGGDAKGRAQAARATPVKGRTLPVKYRDDQGNTWTGRGSTPRWLRTWLEAGKTVEDFAIRD